MGVFHKLKKTEKMHSASIFETLESFDTDF